MKQAAILVTEHKDAFSLRRDWHSPRRWLCWWVGHSPVKTRATLSYQYKEPGREWRPVKTVIELPSCVRCNRLLDYTFRIGLTERGGQIAQAAVTVGTI